VNQLSKSVGAGNPHATFCGNRGRATASGDPVGGAVRLPPIPISGAKRTYPRRVVALSPTSVTDAGIVDDRRSARGSMLAACSRASKAADYLRRLALAQSAEIAA
jgi:hypothetical protein